MNHDLSSGTVEFKETHPKSKMQNRATRLAYGNSEERRPNLRFGRMKFKLGMTEVVKTEVGAKLKPLENQATDDRSSRLKFESSIWHVQITYPTA